MKPDPADWRIARTIFVADDDKVAASYGRHDANSPYRFYYKQLQTKLTKAGRHVVFKERMDQPDAEITYDFVLDRLCMYGTVNKVVDQILALREQIGDFGELVYAGMDWVDAKLEKRSMQLMAEQVMPRVNAAIAKEQGGKRVDCMNKPAELKLETVPVWINGKAVAPAGRTGEVFNPATGQVTKKVVFADAKLIDAAVSAAAAAFPGVARHAAAAPRAGDAEVPVFTAEESKGTCADRHRRARQDAPRRDGLGAARHRGGRVRLRHPAAPEGRVLAERRHRRSTRTPCASRSASAPASRRSTSR